MSKQSDLDNIKKYLNSLARLEAATEQWGLQVFKLAAIGALPCSEIIRYNKMAIYTNQETQKTLDLVYRATASDPRAEAAVDRLLGKKTRPPVLFGYSVGATSSIMLQCPPSDAPPDPKQLKMFGTFSAQPCSQDAPNGQTLGNPAAAVAAPALFTAGMMWVIVGTTATAVTLFAISSFMGRAHQEEMEKNAAETERAAAILAETGVCMKNTGGTSMKDWKTCNAIAIKNHPAHAWDKGFLANLGSFAITVGVVAVAGIGTYYLAKTLSQRAADSRAYA